MDYKSLQKRIMTIKENAKRILTLERKMIRMEALLWYTAGALSINLVGANGITFLAQILGI